MKILILGATGMLGSTLYKFLSEKKDISIIYYSRTEPNSTFFNIENYRNIKGDLIYGIEKIIKAEKPDYIINCIGIIKQIKDNQDHIKNIEINSLFPHKLNKLAVDYNSRLIHFSTDCVFSGKKGNYLENDMKDAYDLYGISKKLGEIDYSDNTLTIRTSIIGNELKVHKSLLDWVLFNKNKKLNGYSEAYFSGLTTLEISKTIYNNVIYDFKPGLYNLSSFKINKFDLLNKINEIWKLNKTIIEHNEIKLDKSLNSTKFRTEYNYTPKNWDLMLKETYEYYERNYRKI